MYITESPVSRAMNKYTSLFYHLYINIASLIKIACLYNKNINDYFPNSVLCAVNKSYIIKRKVMWTNEMITKWKMLDPITNCLNYLSLFFLEMYGDLSGKFLCRYWALEGEMLNVFIATKYKRNWQVDSPENVWYFKRLL